VRSAIDKTRVNEPLKMTAPSHPEEPTATNPFKTDSRSLALADRNHIKKWVLVFF